MNDIEWFADLPDAPPTETTTEHPAGVVPSRSAYISGCRCADCTRLNNVYVNQHRKANGYKAVRIQHRVERMARQWVRVNHPEIYQSFINQAYAEIGQIRRPPGRPPKT